MEEITAENYALESLRVEEEEEEAHRLSLCDLIPMEETNSGFTNQSPKTSSAQPDHLFEFLVSQPAAATRSSYSGIIFCGKIIHEKEELNEYQKRDYFATIKSQSFRKSCLSYHDATENRQFSSSTRFSCGLTRPKCSTGDLDYHMQRVNITSLTSMSAKSRRWMFMFGPVKFKPEMELSAIKQRQAKRAPVERTSPSGGGKSQWGVLKSSLRGRSHLTRVLARSLGCIPVERGGVERWVGVSN